MAQQKDSPQGRNGDLLILSLDAAVPLWIESIRHTDGGPPLDFRDRINRIQDVMSETGEAILYRTKPGETARAFNALAEGIAILSFCPGGVTCFGRTWDGRNRLGCAADLTHQEPDLIAKLKEAIDMFGRQRS